jgi:dTDP-4-amino-4,6-dideoxygalactose transaminase
MKLAINGGTPVKSNLFPNQANIGVEEKGAVQRVMETQMLSEYRGNAEKYRGGEEIQKLEKAWSDKFGSTHSIAINSCTSALHVACMAIGLKPGDEVIVTPYSMSCSATAPLLCGAIPVFADVEKDYFCLDPEDVERKITDKTKAIIAVDLFGQPFSEKIQRLAEEKGIYLIEDAAQAVGASMQHENEDKHYTGNLGHIGCFSFTQGKHLTAGEGGMITTNDDYLAEKCRLLLNHAEAVINDFGDGVLDFPYNLSNMWGFNMRMTEIQAAIVQEQLSSGAIKKGRFLYWKTARKCNIFRA